MARSERLFEAKHQIEDYGDKKNGLRATQNTPQNRTAHRTAVETSIYYKSRQRRHRCHKHKH